MEITKKMYELAKEIVATWETEQCKPEDTLNQKMEKTFQRDNYNNPFKEGEVVPCCGERYCFSYARMKYLPRNPKLRYREKNAEGDVDYDAESKNPSFVEYNNCREAIRQAKAKGLKHVHWQISVAVTEEIIKDGYKDHRDKLSTISW